MIHSFSHAEITATQLKFVKYLEHAFEISLNDFNLSFNLEQFLYHENTVNRSH